MLFCKLTWLKGNDIASLLKEVNAGLSKSNLSDKEKYILSHKADTLEAIRK